MNVQIYAGKRNFDVQKAERFFKERGIAYQLVDMKRHAPGLKELTLFAARVGLEGLIDESLPAYKESTLRFMPQGEARLAALAEHPEFLRTPIVRSGREVTVGYRPDVWTRWLDGSK